MLALFVSYASCQIYWNWASSSGSNKDSGDATATSDRDFDITYSKNGDDKNYSTTAENKGWKVALRSPSGDSGQMYQVLGMNKGVLKQDGLQLTVTTEFDQSLGENFMRIIFNVKNTGTTVSKFDLGTYADISIRKIDNSDVIPLSGPKGFTMVGTKEDVTNNDAITLLAGGLLDVTDVDYLWYGEHSDDNIHIGKNLEKLEPLKDKNSVFELGWTSKTIQPGQTQSFNVLLAMGKTIRPPPKVVCSPEIACELDTKCKVNVKYESSNQDVPLKLYYKIEGVSSEFKEVDNFTTGAEKTSQDYTFEFDGGSEPKEYKVIFYAQDTMTTLKSDEYTVTAKVQHNSKEDEEQKKKKEQLKLIGIIIGSVAGGLILIGAITYLILSTSKKRKNDEEEEKPENYIDDVQTTNKIAKEVENINNIFTVSVEEASDQDAPEFVTEDTIKL